MKIVGVSTLCGMAVWGFLMTRGSITDGERAEARELMLAILETGNAGVGMPHVKNNSSGAEPAVMQRSTLALAHTGASITSLSSDFHPKMKWHNAVEFCKQQKKRLPAMDELMAMYKNECTKGASSTTCIKWFWSSEETDAAHARGIYFGFGSVFTSRKYNGNNFVRCQ